MGGFSSFASTAFQALSVAGSIAGAVDKYQNDSGLRAYEEEKRRYKITMDALQKEEALKKEQNSLSLQQAEDDRQGRLRAAIARQRAAFGASGVGSGTGSSQAYLLGLADDSQEEGRQLSQAAEIKNRILEQEYNARQSLNMLELANARERKKLKQISALF